MLLRQVSRLGQETRDALSLDPARIQADMRVVLIGVFNTRPDGLTKL